MTTPSIEHLENEIERLVHEHITACHRAAAAAVERAFAASAPRAKSAGRKSAAARSSSRTMGVRRTEAEIATLGERLYEAVCAQPGEAMAALAPRLGATPRELHRPMAQLKRAGRVRSVGQRHQTRYFPMAAEGASRKRS
jgi:hypothetical protein